MNRITALLLGLATLLAHTLAIHITDTGEFAPPYEIAHRAYHLARVWIREGLLEWNVGAPELLNGGMEGYPSPVWIGVAAIAERLYQPVSTFTQTVGILCALLTVVVSTRFDVDRLTGVVPALLLVTSGAFAAAGPSGTEVPLIALLGTSILVSYQLHHPIVLSLAMALMVATRPEGLVFVGVVALLSLADRLRRATGRAPHSTAPPAFAFLPAALVAAWLIYSRNGSGASLYGSLLVELFVRAPERTPEGLEYALDFAITTITPVLLVIPVLALLVGKLSGTGARALALGIAWVALIIARGGGTTAFTVDLVPALPLFAIAIQQGLVAALDTRIGVLEQLSWGLLLPSCLLGAFASKFPGDLGPIKARAMHSLWLEQAFAEPNYGARALRGRASLGDEIERTLRLRNLALFLRDNVDPGYSILTPWPGTMSYLSGLTVVDMLGRATPALGEVDPGSLSARPDLDLVAQLEREVDFVIPGLVNNRELAENRRGDPIDSDLLSLDPVPLTPSRGEQLQKGLGRFELVCLPVQGERGSFAPLYILRNKALGLAPRLGATHEDGMLEIQLLPAAEDARPGHPQLGRLDVVLFDEAGRKWTLDPRGVATEDSRIHARTEISIQPSPAGLPIRLMRTPLTELPSGPPARMWAQLSNPVSRRNTAMGAIGAPVEIEFR